MDFTQLLCVVVAHAHRLNEALLVQLRHGVRQHVIAVRWEGEVHLRSATVCSALLTGLTCSSLHLVCSRILQSMWWQLCHLAAQGLFLTFYTGGRLSGRCSSSRRYLAKHRGVPSWWGLDTP